MRLLATVAVRRLLYDVEPVDVAVQYPSLGEFSAALCPEASLNIGVRLRFAPRLTKISSKSEHFR
jgi:hypothetical protein